MTKSFNTSVQIPKCHTNPDDDVVLALDVLRSRSSFA